MTGILHFYPSIVIFNFAAAILIILKHATTLRLSELSAKPALVQAESDYQKLTIGLKILQCFSATPQEYSVLNFVDFIMGVSVCLLLHSPDNIWNSL